jgi:hypothetical protein
MPRRRPTNSPDAIEAELSEIEQRRAQLKKELRRIKNKGGEVRKLEEKLAKQLGTAKWTVEQIKDVNPDWDLMAFYNSVEPRQPARRGPRRRSERQGAEA